jgi:osmotically inducible protein OsmC
LIGAAHAACYTMYLTSVLGKAGHEGRHHTTSTVSMDPNNGSPNINQNSRQHEGA